MEDRYQICQQYVRHHWRRLIVRRFLHVAVDHVLLLERLEKFIPRFRRTQSLVGEIARVAVQDAPVVGIRRYGIHLLILYRHPTRVVILQNILSPCITEELCQMILTTHGKPVATMHLTAKDGRTLRGLLRHPLRQGQITLPDSLKQFLCPKAR